MCDHVQSNEKEICIDCKMLCCPDCIKSHEAIFHKVYKIRTSLLQKYDFLKFYGKGAFGLVYLVKKKDNGELFALKIIEEVDEFENSIQEIQYLSKMDHPNIIKYFFNEELPQEKRLAIFMEPADQELSEIIVNLNKDLAFKYFKDICKGMEYLHVTQQIFHRDIKPSNILIKEGTAKLCDFGIAKKLKNSLITLSNSIGFGTFDYQSPEVLKGNKYNEKCDIWSLGLFFNYILTNGKKCFEGNNRDERKSNILKNKINIDKSLIGSLYEKIILGINIGN